MLKDKFYTVLLMAIIAILTANHLARGGGMELEGVGTKAITMGGAFIGLADDSSAIYWNPAGLARLEGARVDMGIYTMSSIGWDRNSVSNLPPSQMRPEKGDVFMKLYPSEPIRFNDESEFWPFAAVMPALTAFKSFDGYTIGGGIYPTLGIGAAWDDKIYDPKTSAAMDASYYSMIGVINFNATIAKQLSDKFSVGLGVELIYVRGMVDADKNYRNSKSPLSPDYEFRLESEMDGAGAQGIIGLHYKLTPKLKIGCVYRTGATFDLKGDTSVRQTFLIGKQELGLSEKSDHTQRFVYPASWGIGIAYEPFSSLTLTFDWQRTDWTKYLFPPSTMDFKDEGFMLRDVREDPGWVTVDKFRFGLEHRYSERLALRGGFFYENSGMPADFEGFTTTFCGYAKYANLGLGYQWDKWSVDIMGGTMWGETPYKVGHH